MRTTDIPSFALSVRRQHERAFLCAHQDSNSAHLLSPQYVVRPLEKRTLAWLPQNPCSFASRFDWYPNLHAAHPGARIEFFRVTFEKVRRAGHGRRHLLAEIRAPVVPDGIERVTPF